MEVKWYHGAIAAALAYWWWNENQAKLDALASNLAAVQNGAAAGAAKAAADVDAEHRAALAARAEIAKRDAALAAQRDITTETVGAVTGTVRAVLPPTVNAPPRVVTNPPLAAAGEKVLALDANQGDTRIVPKEGSQSIARDTTYGSTPTATTLQSAQSIPTKKGSMVVSADLDDLRDLRTT